MLNKIYAILLAIVTATSSVLIYMPYSWLQSRTDPRDIQTNYLYFYNISWSFLFISTLILLIAANVLLWKTKQAWAMWASLLYFTVFIIAHKFWLDSAFFSFQQTNRFTDSSISFGAITGVVLIVLAAVIVYFDQYLIKRLHNKMYPPLLPVETLPEDALIEEKIDQA